MVIKRLLRLRKGRDKKDQPKVEAPKGAEKRAFIRIEYPPKKMPIFRVGKDGKQEMKVINISERGIKLLNYKKLEVGSYIRGTIVFLNGTSVTLSGQAVWKEGKEIGVLIMGTIPYSVMEEQRAFSRES